jgi:hypothetical protein
MYYFYDKQSNLTTPSGRVLTPTDIESDAFYKSILSNDSVIGINNGIFGEIARLDVLKTRYSVTDEDPQKALEEINNKVKNEEIQTTEVKPTVEALVQQQAETDAALMELAAMIAGE